MSAIKRFLSSAFVQFSVGCVGWAIFPYALIVLFVIPLPYGPYIVYADLIPLAMFLIGVGLAIFTIQKSSLRWLGIGISVTLVFHLVGFFFHGSCVDPFIVPFPFSMISDC